MHRDETTRVLSSEIKRELSPTAITDAVLAALASGSATSASLSHDPSGHAIELRRVDGSLDVLEIDDDVAAAIAVRLASATALNALAEHGPSNVARLAITDGEHHADVLVSMYATTRGFSVDLRALTVDGREPTIVRSAVLRRCVDCGVHAPAHELVCPNDGGRLEPATENAHVGGTIGPWLVRSILGEGGMGVVFAAEHALLGRKAAIKVVRHSLGQSRGVHERFLAEARAASRLRHPRVVDVYDYGVLGDGRPYFVMELLEGESLASLLWREKCLAPERALRIARAIAEALASAHRSEIVHHDLKPSNVMIAPDGSIKLVDFGAAAIGASIARPGVLYGTPSYTSPERARGDAGDSRSDLYSLGIVLYELLAGFAPFVFDSAEDTFLAQIADPPPPLTVDSPSVLRIVDRLLAKSPAERYQRADELIADIDRALQALERSEFARWLP